MVIKTESRTGIEQIHIKFHHSMDGNRERKGVVEFHANVFRRNVK